MYFFDAVVIVVVLCMRAVFLFTLLYDEHLFCQITIMNIQQYATEMGCGPIWAFQNRYLYFIFLVCLWNIFQHLPLQQVMETHSIESVGRSPI